MSEESNTSNTPTPKQTQQAKQPAPETKAPATEAPEASQAAVDIGSLASLNFGPSWSDSKQSAKPTVHMQRGKKTGGPRREGGGKGGTRPDRRPRTAGSSAGNASGGARPARSHNSERSNQRGGEKTFGSNARHEGGSKGRGKFNARGPRGNTPHMFEPTLRVQFYPEDNSFEALIDALKKSKVTYELFELCNILLEKPERYTVALSPFTVADPNVVPSKKAEAEKAAQAAKEKDPQQPSALYAALPSALVFETQAQALEHVCGHHADIFFTTKTVEVEAPKGNFTQISKCPKTGVLLGPPNYHGFNAAVKKHYTQRIAGAGGRGIPFEKYKLSLSAVADEELVKQWVAQQTQQTIYIPKTIAEIEASIAAYHEAAEKAATATEKPETEAAEKTEAAATETPEASEAEATEEAPKETETEEGAEEPKGLTTMAAVHQHLVENCEGHAVREVSVWRLAGSKIASIKGGNIKKSIQAALEGQQRFPLETANGLRGRLRRMGLNLYKAGKKNITFVCGVKRTLRTHTDTFTPSAQALIDFLLANPKTLQTQLAEKHLGIEIKESAELTQQQQEQVRNLLGDLNFLISSGYITLFSSGALEVSPVQTEAEAKKEAPKEASAENAQAEAA